MSVVLALIPALVVGVPFGIVNGVAQAAGVQLIDEKKMKEKNAIRLGTLLQKKKLTLLEKKELKLLQLAGNKPVFLPQQAPPPVHSFVIPTSIRNIEFLLKTIQELGTRQICVKEDVITADFSGLSITYQPDSNGYIALHFKGNIKEEEAYEFKKILETQYGKLLQEAVYSKIKQKAAEQGLELETEQIKEDDTIVLTYNVR